MGEICILYTYHSRSKYYAIWGKYVYYIRITVEANITQYGGKYVYYIHITVEVNISIC